FLFGGQGDSRRHQAPCQELSPSSALVGSDPGRRSAQEIGLGRTLKNSPQKGGGLAATRWKGRKDRCARRLPARPRASLPKSRLWLKSLATRHALSCPNRHKRADASSSQV